MSMLGWLASSRRMAPGRFLVLILVIIASLAFPATGPAASAASGSPLDGEPLLAYYPFEGNANDASGNGYHGTVHGAVLAAGYEGQAYAFDGNDSISALVNINPGVHPKLTMGAWARATVKTPIRQVISHDNSGYDRSLGIDNRGGGSGWSAFAGSAGVLGYSPVTLGQWTFVAVVYDQAAKKATLYVNGNVYQKTNATMGPGHGYILIGDNPDYAENFYGTIDNVFIFGDALTAEQIAYIRDNGSAALNKVARGGTISGTVYSGTTPLPNAPVQACMTGGACSTVNADGNGKYIFSGLMAGQYQLTGFPPSGYNLNPGTAGPVGVALATDKTGVDIYLQGLIAMPADTWITARYITADGLPVVFWGQALTLKTEACAGGTAAYEILLNGVVRRTGTMTEGPDGVYTAHIAPLYPLHGYVEIRITTVCADGTIVDNEFNAYIDPSGTVKDTLGNPIVGATVVLFRADGAEGPFVQVPDESANMSPANRKNPDLTDGTGHFGWDVIAGFYKVEASYPGCTTATSDVLTIPPAVTDLSLVLDCGTQTDPALTFKAPLSNVATYDLTNGDTLPIRFRWGTGSTFIHDESVIVTVTDVAQPDYPVTAWVYGDIAIDDAAGEYQVDFASGDYGLGGGNLLSVDVYIGDQLVGSAKVQVN